jgi:ABC-type uncharacterized transport system auxiliary subunit
LDAEEHITNIFWADAQMIIDYKLFGDVVSFDTAYRTNKEYIARLQYLLGLIIIKRL